MTMTFTILGCGSSGGVPRLGSGWGACDPENPKNRRRRCSLLVEKQGEQGTTRILVDTSPDLREQLLSHHVTHLDAVLITHEHADHTHGLDDLRPLVIHMHQRIPVYTDDRTLEVLLNRFGYCFQTPPNSDYPPICNPHRIQTGMPVVLEGAGGSIEALPIRMIHGSIEAMGFRFGTLAYASDVNYMPEDSIAAFEGLDILILDALQYRPHATHFNVEQALAFIDQVKPKRAILTNLHTHLDYDVLSSELPAHIEPAYDGMKVVC